MARVAKFTGGLAAIAAIALVLPAASSATVTIGSTLGTSNANDSCPSPPCTRSQSVLPGRLVTSPVTGTIVAWRATVSPTTRARLRVISPFGADLKFAGTGAIETPGTSKLAASASLPIAAGDRIGIDLLDPTMAGLSALREIANPAASWDYWQGGPPDGATVPPTGTSANELLLAADVLASNQVTVTGVKRKKNGSAKVSLNVPNAGTLSAGSAAGHKPLVKPQSLMVGAGPLEVVLRPSKRAKGMLADRGKAKGTVALTLSPSADPIAGTTPLKLKLKLKD
jgi:hypothetical protein